MSKIKNGGLDQYDAGPFEQQQFGTAGVEGVNFWLRRVYSIHVDCRVYTLLLVLLYRLFTVAFIYTELE